MIDTLARRKRPRAPGVIQTAVIEAVARLQAQGNTTPTRADVAEESQLLPYQVGHWLVKLRRAGVVQCPAYQRNDAFTGGRPSN